MKMMARLDGEGRYTWYGTTGKDSPPEGNGVYYGVVNVNNQYHDIRLNQPTNLPERPSLDHDFDYATKTWIPNETQAWARVRFERDRLLSQTDWMVTKAVETGSPMPEGWATYRQALRDVTSQWDPWSIAWPEKPA